MFPNKYIFTKARLKNKFVILIYIQKKLINYKFIQ